jgi:hypothetical protein
MGEQDLKNTARHPEGRIKASPYKSSGIAGDTRPI